VIRHFTLSAETGLVPVADRLRYMGLARVVFTAVALAYWWALPAERALPAATLAALTGGYFLVAAAGWTSWRLGRSVAITAFGLSLLVDGLYLALVAYSPTELLTPLRYLVVAHVITVTLVASFRTGLKVTIWHTILVWLAFRLHEGGAAGDRPAFHLLVFLLVVWTAGFCTATFAAINERDLRRRGYDMEALARLALTLENAGTPHQVAQAAATAIAEDFAVARVAFLHASDDDVAVLGSCGLSAVDVPVAGPAGDELIERALGGRATLLVNRSDRDRDPWLSASFPQASNLALVPMFADDHPIGLVCLEYGARRGSRIESRVVGVLEQFASHASLALANALLLARMSRLASTDGLTGAANRRTFDERLARELRRARPDGEQVSLLMLDVDHFKRVNDEHGHSVGDDVLRHLVQLIEGLCRPQDLLARYGGEEFALILPDASAEDAKEIAERARTELIASQPPVPVTISIGIATSPVHASSPGALIEAADGALYRAKTDGRNRSVCVSDPAVMSPDPPARSPLRIPR